MQKSIISELQMANRIIVGKHLNFSSRTAETAKFLQHSRSTTEYLNHDENYINQNRSFLTQAGGMLGGMCHGLAGTTKQQAYPQYPQTRRAEVPTPRRC